MLQVICKTLQVTTCFSFIGLTYLNSCTSLMPLNYETSAQRVTVIFK